MGPTVTAVNASNRSPRTSTYNDGYQPWMTEIPTLRCPSDPGVGLPSMGRTNYGACLGDANRFHDAGPMSSRLTVSSFRSQEIRASGRGVFVARTEVKFRDILDGLANTIMAGELATDLGDREARTQMNERVGTTEVQNNPLLAEMNSIQNVLSSGFATSIYGLEIMRVEDTVGLTGMGYSVRSIRFFHRIVKSASGLDPLGLEFCPRAAGIKVAATS